MSRAGTKAEQEQQSQLAIEASKRQLGELTERIAQCKQKQGELVARIQQQSEVNA